MDIQNKSNIAANQIGKPVLIQRPDFWIKNLQSDQVLEDAKLCGTSSIKHFKSLALPLGGFPQWLLEPQSPLKCLKLCVSVASCGDTFDFTEQYKAGKKIRI